jgi:hypothetical protein
LKLVAIPNDKIDSVGYAIGIEITAAPCIRRLKFVCVPDDEIGSVDGAAEVGIARKVSSPGAEIKFASF